MIGRSRSYARSLEEEGALPSLKTLLEICDYLDVELKDFFDEEKARPESHKKATDIVDALDERSPGSQTLDPSIKTTSTSNASSRPPGGQTALRSTPTP